MRKVEIYVMLKVKCAIFDNYAKVNITNFGTKIIAQALGVRKECCDCVGK